MKPIEYARTDAAADTVAYLAADTAADTGADITTDTTEDAAAQMKVLGITGGVGAGKSTVLSYMALQYSAAIIQCDTVAAQLQQPGETCYAPMLEVLGSDYLQEDGTWNRAKIAEVLFADPQIRAQINAIVHPAVYRQVQHLLHMYGQEKRPFAVIEAALLLESGYGEICDEIWYIYAENKVRENRLMRSRGYTQEKIRRIMAGQLDDAAFRAGCTLTIDNSSDFVQNTYDQIDKGLKTHGFLHSGQRQQR